VLLLRRQDKGDFFILSFPQGQEKDELPLSPTGKLMPPKGQFGILFYRGQDKREFQFRGSRESYAIIEPCGKINGYERPIGFTFSIGAR
jgi:hypothetical protein